MRKRNLTPKNENVRREQDPIPWRYCLLTLVCGLLLVVGFFWAARQHFSAMDFGIKNAKLRQQKESLEAEKRLLDRNREISLSPAEIKKAAKKIGLQDLTAESIEVISSIKNSLSPQTENKGNETPQKTFVSKTAKTAKVETKANQKKPLETILDVKSKDAPKDTKTKSQVLPAANSRQEVLKK